LSTSAANQVDRAPAWKQEVNRRLAAHKSRVGSSAEHEVPAQTQQETSSRAAQAAARVAARYAKAPSYSEMMAEEARAAVRAAEAASQAAYEAQAAAESLLAGLEAGLEAASRAEAAVEPAGPSVPSLSQTVEGQSFSIRWEADMPAPAIEAASVRARHGLGVLRIPVEKWREPGLPAQDALGAEGIEVVEAAQPIHANLIQFPRELVATRKVRPRRAEGPHAAADQPERQLSIFEVDPGSISTQPSAAEAAAEPAAVWTGPEWSGIELDEEPREEPVTQAATAAVLQLAPMNLRLMAAVVDGALILGAGLGAALVAGANVTYLPGIKEIEWGAAVVLAVIGALYHALFFTLAEGTPGMKYARISLCTFDDQIPTRAQRCGRLGALLLSLLPVGLGVAWAIFDEERLSWHDRLSGTYPRKC
jgi:uncharacterized RDD family membrane protein YckC